MQNRIFFRGPTLVSLNPLRVEYADVLVGDGRILKKGWRLNAPHDVEVIDARGKILFPGLVDGHFDIGAAFTRFIPTLPGVNLADQLTEETLICAAFAASVESIRAGVTSFVCHSRTPSFVRGSLGRIRDTLLSVGVRACASYAAHGDQDQETTASELLEAKDAASYGVSSRCRFLLGAGGGARLTDSTLQALVELGQRYDAAAHVTAGFDAEPVDAEIGRLLDSGLLRAGSIVTLGSPPSPECVTRLQAASVALVHVPTAALSQGRATVPLATFGTNGVLGTFGARADLFEEARLAYARAVAAGEAVTPADVVGMLARSQQLASDLFHLPFGNFEPGSSADILVLDYRPTTPLNSMTLPLHVLFGFSAAQVQHVMVDGQIVIRDRNLQRFDVRNLFRQTQRAALDLWGRASTEEYPGLSIPLREDAPAPAADREAPMSPLEADEDSLEIDILETSLTSAAWFVCSPEAQARAESEPAPAAEAPRLPKGSPPPPPRPKAPAPSPVAVAVAEVPVVQRDAAIPAAPAEEKAPPPPEADPFGFGII